MMYLRNLPPSTFGGLKPQICWYVADLEHVRHLLWQFGGHSPPCRHCMRYYYTAGSFTHPRSARGALHIHIENTSVWVIGLLCQDTCSQILGPACVLSPDTRPRNRRSGVYAFSSWVDRSRRACESEEEEEKYINEQINLNVDWLLMKNMTRPDKMGKTPIFQQWIEKIN